MWANAALFRPVLRAALPRATRTGQKQIAPQSLSRGMAGHSKWANIQHRKGRNDKVKAATNTRMARAVQTAVTNNGGDPDPNTNFHLDAAMRRAHKAGVPNAVIMRAIENATGKHHSGQLHHVTYEGSGPGGALFIVEALTDNKNRTAPNVRHIFRSHGGHMEAKTADFAFETRGYMEVDVASTKAATDMLAVAAAEGATDFNVPDDLPEATPDQEQPAVAHADAPKGSGNVSDGPQPQHAQVYCEHKDVMHLSKALKASGFHVSNERIIRFPTQTVSIEDDETLNTLHKLVEALEEDEDISEVFHNIL